MGSENTRTLLDRLEKVSDPTLARLRDASDAASSGAPGPGAAFKVGDAVIDLATGQKATVRGAEPRAGRGEFLFRLQLADGREVFRGRAELAADQAIAPAPER